MKQVSSKQKLVFFLFLLFVSTLLHFKSYNQPPLKNHVWAQSDHYAVALGFLDNGFNFFRPKTFALTHQFPPQKVLQEPKGITAVDFPFIHYVAAINMELFGTKAPWVFRLTSLAWSFLGLFYLFYCLTKIKGVVVAYISISFVIFLPIYFFYQNSFLPSMAAFNSLLLGTGFLLKNRYLQDSRAFYYGILFLTLASLMRFTQVIFLLALSCSYSVNFIKERKDLKKNILILAGLFLVAVYFVYNSYLSSHYGSVFLNKPIIAQSFAELKNNLTIQIALYSKSLLTTYHLLMIVLLLFILFKERFCILFRDRNIELWVLLSFFGVLSFNLIMSLSMSAHDYYALDTWIPLLTILFIYAVLQVDLSKYAIALSLCALIILGMMYTSTKKQYNRYTSPTYILDQIVLDFKESSAFLNEKIPEKKKVLIICQYGWNLPMIGWHRDVYRVAENYEAQISEAIRQSYDFIITYNRTYQQFVLDNTPDFENHLIRMDDNELVTIWKQKEKNE